MNSELVRFHEMLRSKDVIGIKDFVKKMGVNYTQKGDNWNFLHSCLVPVVFTPDPEIVQLLVDLGVDINARDSYLNTPLHYAVRVKNIEIIKIIFEAGAEIDPENKDGITPLQMTLLSKPFSYPVIRYLLSCGANPQHKCKGRTIAEMAEILSFGEFEDLKNLFLR